MAIPTGHRIRLPEPFGGHIHDRQPAPKTCAGIQIPDIGRMHGLIRMPGCGSGMPDEDAGKGGFHCKGPCMRRTTVVRQSRMPQAAVPEIGFRILFLKWEPSVEPGMYKEIVPFICIIQQLLAEQSLVCRRHIGRIQGNGKPVATG